MKKLLIAAAERNKGPISEVLKNIFPEKFQDKYPISVLEVGSGTGQHAVHFSKEMPYLKWHPSDMEGKYLESIREYIKESQLSNVREPVHLDVTRVDSNVTEIDKEYDAIMATNIIHITSWNVSQSLFKLASRLLSSGGMLVTYGPYSVHGEISPESNIKFNESLQAQNSEWGLRDIEDLEVEAKKNGFSFDAMFDMPSNNKTLVWTKQN